MAKMTRVAFQFVGIGPVSQRLTGPITYMVVGQFLFFSHTVYAYVD